jgi:hypothetical protein
MARGGLKRGDPCGLGARDGGLRQGECAVSNGRVAERFGESGNVQILGQRACWYFRDREAVMSPEE